MNNILLHTGTSNTKKVLLVTENLGAGGAERQLVGLAVMLKKKGYNVKLVTYLENQFYEPVLLEYGVEYKLIRNAPKKIKRLYQINKEIKSFNPDTIISFLTAPNKMLCLLKPFNRKRLIVSERNTTSQWGIREAITFNLYRFANVIVPNSFNESDNIIAHKPFLVNKIKPITNFVDTDKFIPIKRERNEVPTILCVGRITEQKNVLRFLEAIKILKDKNLLFKVKWFGTHAYANYTEQVLAKQKELDLTGHITFYEPSSNIINEYQHADIFCLPSIKEGYPNVLCEAMSCGLPVACGNVCENPRIVDDGVHGYLFDPYSPTEIAETIERLLTFSVEERMRMGECCRKAMVANNSIDSFVEKYITIL